MNFRFSIPVLIMVFLLLHTKNCEGWHCFNIPITAKGEEISVGAHRFFAEINDTFGSGFISCEQFRTDYLKDYKVTIYPVVINDVILRGWLRVNFYFNARRAVCSKQPALRNICKQLVALRLSAEDDKFQNIGEFSDLPAKYCQGATQVSKYQLLPCKGTPANEPLQPTGIAYTSPVIFDNVKGYVLPETPLDSDVNYYWKFSQYYCNKKTKIRFRIHATTVGTIYQGKDNNEFANCLFAPHFWVTINNDFTSADPFPTNLDDTKKIPCSSNDIHDKRNTWYKAPSRTKYESSYYGGSSESCGYGLPYATYYGRCPISNSSANVGIDKELVCSQSKTVGYFHYDTYIAQRFTNLSIERDSLQCCKISETLNKTLAEEIERIIVIPPPTTPTTPTTTTPTPPTLEELKEEERIGVRLWKDSGDVWSTGGRIWKMRKFHGICMSILTLFVIPVNFFLTRYYKETFMKTRIEYCMVWYFVHLMAIPIGAFLLSLGTHAARKSSQVAGHSWTAAASEHRKMGWTIIIGFLILSATGGIRIYKDVFRRVSMCFHWLYGTVVYICLLILVMRSTLIPGTPSASYDKAHESHEISLLAVFHNQTVVILVFLWILIEIIFHIIMSFYMWKIDKQLKFTSQRFYTPVPIPLIHDFDEDDLPGSKLRKNALVVYLCLSAFITATVCIIIGGQSLNNRGFGPLMCSHTYDKGKYHWRTNTTVDHDCGGSHKWLF